MRQSVKRVLAWCVGALALTVGLVLVGCGSTPSYDAAAEKNFVGVWELSGMTTEEGETSTEDLEAMKTFGLTLYVEYEDDHTGSFEIFGQPLPFSWKATGESEVSMTFDQDALEAMQSEEELVNTEQKATVADGVLTMEGEDSIVMTFKQIDPKDKVSPIGSDEAEGSDAATDSATSESATSDSATE